MSIVVANASAAGTVTITLAEVSLSEMGGWIEE